MNTLATRDQRRSGRGSTVAKIVLGCFDAIEIDPVDAECAAASHGLRRPVTGVGKSFDAHCLQATASAKVSSLLRQ